MRALILIAALALGACASKLPPPETVVRTQVVKEAVPVPCPALEQLNDEPLYVDVDRALLEAKDIAMRVQLLLMGRAQRNHRLAEYQSARASCQAQN